MESTFQDEERVQLRISERLREYMEYDYDMITKYKKQHILPARTPVILILENFVKQTAMKMISSVLHAQEGTRRRSTQQRGDKKEKELDKIISTYVKQCNNKRLEINFILFIGLVC